MRVHAGEAWNIRLERWVGDRPCNQFVFFPLMHISISCITIKSNSNRPNRLTSCDLSIITANLWKALWVTEIIFSDGFSFLVWTISRVFCCTLRDKVPSHLFNARSCYSAAQRWRGRRPDQAEFARRLRPSPELSLETTQRAGLQLSDTLVRAVSVAVAGNVSCKQ